MAEYLLRYDCNFIIVYWSDLQAGNALSFVSTTQEAAYHTGYYLIAINLYLRNVIHTFFELYY